MRIIWGLYHCTLTLFYVFFRYLALVAAKQMGYTDLGVTQDNCCSFFEVMQFQVFPTNFNINYKKQHWPLRLNSDQMQLMRSPCFVHLYTEVGCLNQYSQACLITHLDKHFQCDLNDLEQKASLVLASPGTTQPAVSFRHPFDYVPTALADLTVLSHGKQAKSQDLAKSNKTVGICYSPYSPDAV